MLCAFLTVLIFVPVMLIQWWVKLAPSYLSRQWNQYNHILCLKKKKKPVLPKNSKSINFIKYSPLSTHLKNILIDEMGSKHRV